jgi:hypothetical protein
MAITFVGEVQKWNYTDSSATETFTVTTTISAGNFAVVIWHQENDATNILTSVTDSAGILGRSPPVQPTAATVVVSLTALSRRR